MDRFRSILLFLFAFVSFTAVAQTTTPAAAPKITYIKAGRLFDATSDAMKSNMVIVVAGDRIQKIGSASEINIPAGSNVIDLSRATVLPGLIDCHTHLGSRADRYNPIYDFRESPFFSAFAGVV